MDSASDHRVEADLERVVFWMREQQDKRPIALVTMGSRHDYAARYHLSMQLPGVEVINLTDPRVRKARYRSLHPDDFALFLFLDDGLNRWPPDETQKQWLKTNLRCVADDPLDRFLHAVTQRDMVEQNGIHVLTSTVGGRLEAGQIWSGLDKQEAVNNGLCGG
jgi:hypothetical protein